MEYRKAAALVKQGSLTLYATSFKVGDFLQQGFYSIDQLDPEENSSGYQRVLDTKRTKRISGYFSNAWKEGDAFLPTSILLATNKPVEYDAKRNEITFNLRDVGPFNVVDGQHRIKGLVSAAKQHPAMKEFQVAANIAVNVDEVSQMCHFLIVNTTQKSVDKSVEQSILARLTSMIHFKTIPSLPRWIQRQVDRGEDQQALNIIRYLNQNYESPWYQKIAMANQTDGLDKTTIRQKSFAHSVKKFILSSNNPLMHSEDLEMRNRILCNYWNALKEILVTGNEGSSVLFKTAGINLFHMISPTVFSQLFNYKDFRVETIIRLLTQSFEKLDADSAILSDPHFWQRGAGASSLNMTTMRKFAVAINQAIISLDREQSFRV